MTFTIAVLNKKKDSYLLYFFEYTVKHINSNLAFCFLSFLSFFISFLSFFSLIILVTILIHVTRLRYNPVLFYSKILFPCLLSASGITGTIMDPIPAFSRDMFGTLPNIKDEVYRKNVERLLAVNFFVKSSIWDVWQLSKYLFGI